eukprot:5721091-Pleurochrysis_carterae.AAC.1
MHGHTRPACLSGAGVHRTPTACTRPTDARRHGRTPCTHGAPAVPHGSSVRKHLKGGEGQDRSLALPTLASIARGAPPSSKRVLGRYKP